MNLELQGQFQGTLKFKATIVIPNSQLFHIQKVEVVFACNFKPRQEVLKIALEISLFYWIKGILDGLFL
jgi:hypothetical protein